MKRRFILTVDVEDFFLPRPPYETYRAQSGGGPAYGVPLIMDLLEEQGGRGTFFVDVYNRRTVTEEVIHRTCIEIAERGHEVALHTHPAFPDGQRGYGMAQTMRTLSLAEQTTFIAEGIELIRGWIGKPPTSHRAGGYGANYDTLRALAANGVGVDSSLFHGYPYCDLNVPPLAINRPVRWGEVLEVPITVTQSELRVGAFGRGIPLVSIVKKIDPDWCSPEELRQQVEAVSRVGLDPIILFLHSYSLLDLKNGFKPKRKAIETLRRLFAHLTTVLSGELVTLESVAHSLLGRAPSEDKELPPRVTMNIVGRDWRTGLWLAGTVRPSHLYALWQRQRAS
jgi:peptidoglycan/xylan/chitin deacetylase (PgdA/CDA1 family)